MSTSGSTATSHAEQTLPGWAQTPRPPSSGLAAVPGQGGQGAGDSLASNRIDRESVPQSPEPVVDGPDEAPGGCLGLVQVPVLDDDGEQAGDGVRVGELVGPGPEQVCHRALRGAHGRAGVDRHPWLAWPPAGEDVAVV